MFLTQGLDHLSDEQKQELLAELESLQDPAAQDVRDWLDGKYLVGSECLTD